MLITRSVFIRMGSLRAQNEGISGGFQIMIYASLWICCNFFIHCKITFYEGAKSGSNMLSIDGATWPIPIGQMDSHSQLWITFLLFFQILYFYVHRMAVLLLIFWLKLHIIKDITKANNCPQAQFLNSNYKLVEISVELWKL